MKRQIILIMALMCLLMASAAWMASGAAVRQEGERQASEVLLMTAHALAEATEVVEPDGLSYFLDGWARAMGARVALLGPGGERLYDSVSGAGIVGFSAAPEVVTAMREGAATSVRFSRDDNSHMIFAAVRIRENRVVRIGTPCRDSKWYEGELIWHVLPLMLMVSTLTFAIAMPLLSGAFRPLGRLRSAADAVAAGDYTRREPVRGASDIRALTYAFNHMTEQLEGTIQALSISNKQMEFILGSMTSGFLVVDNNLKVLYANQAAERLLSADELPGRHVVEGTGAARLGELFMMVIRKGGTLTDEIDQRAGRGYTHLRLYIGRLEKSGKPEGAIALIEDLTEQRRFTIAREDFVQNVAHEIKTPLTTIRGFIETMLHGGVSDEATRRRFLSIMEQEVERLNRLVNDALSLDAIDKGNAVFTVVNVSAVMRAIVQMYEVPAGSRKINLAFRDEAPHVTVLCVEDRLRQMFINLIDNAVKYNQEGGCVEVALFVHMDKLRTVVSDNGIGISTEHLPRIFERFYRIDKGRSRDMGGTGLGLSIVKHIALEMRGSVNIESTPGQGTAVMVDIPIVEPGHNA